jgi:hypothetical protein
VPSGTLIVARLATDVNAATASVGDRFQGFLDLDLATNGRLVTTRGSRVYGMVTAVDRNRRAVSVALNDISVGGRVLQITTLPFNAPGGVIPAQTAQPFTLAAAFQVDIMTNVAVR